MATWNRQLLLIGFLDFWITLMKLKNEQKTFLTDAWTKILMIRKHAAQTVVLYVKCLLLHAENIVLNCSEYFLPFRISRFEK